MPAIVPRCFLLIQKAQVELVDQRGSLQYVRIALPPNVGRRNLA